MDKISNADAYTLEQVRRADYATNCGLGFARLQCNQVTSCEELDDDVFYLFLQKQKIDYCSGYGIVSVAAFASETLGGRAPHVNNQIAQAFAQATAPVQLQAGVCVTRDSPE